MGLSKELKNVSNRHETYYEGFYLVTTLGFIDKKGRFKDLFPLEMQMHFAARSSFLKDFLKKKCFICVTAVLTKKFVVEYYLKKDLILIGNDVNRIVKDFMNGEMDGYLRHNVVEVKAPEKNEEEFRVRWCHINKDKPRKVS